ncbi:MAG: DUF4943 family protein [Bacteroidales bacterium]|nr:DUF4943 family protein [Bacteroidales bacterium]
MKNLIFLAVLIVFCFGCKKDEFDPDNPDVATFVQQIRSGTYDSYEKDDNGKKLWPVMPKFSKNHIQSLITFAKDTSHIAIFPTNPVSSRRPFPEGREYYILGECLLWTAEGIRTGYGYGSLDPYLINTAKEDSSTGLKGSEILTVRDLYQNWWNNFADKNWKEANPLEGKPYRWF